MLVHPVLGLGARDHERDIDALQRLTYGVGVGVVRHGDLGPVQARGARRVTDDEALLGAGIGEQSRHPTADPTSGPGDRNQCHIG